MFLIVCFILPVFKNIWTTFSPYGVRKMTQKPNNQLISQELKSIITNWSIKSEFRGESGSLVFFLLLNKKDIFSSQLSSFPLLCFTCSELFSLVLQSKPNLNGYAEYLLILSICTGKYKNTKTNITFVFSMRTCFFSHVVVFFYQLC